jgi:hypothetical protein
MDGSTEHTANDIEQEKDVIAVKKPLFKLGQVVATPNAIVSLAEAQTSAWELLSRHVSGDFGEVDAEDWQANLNAIKDDARILSAFTLKTGERLWVITEADRSSTCVLKPEDY